MARRVRAKTSFFEHAGTRASLPIRASGFQTGALLLRAAARRHAPALRFPAGDRRRPEVLGGAQGPHARSRRRSAWPPWWKTIPLEYGGFEGNIPAGNYGAGSVMLWDRGTFELLGDVPAEAQLARGDLKFRLHGEKLNGDFAIVRMKGARQGQRVAADQEARRVRGAGMGRRGARLERALRPHPGRDRPQDLPAQARQAQDRRRGGPRLGEPPRRARAAKTAAPRRRARAA